MILVLGLMAILWGVGGLMGASKAQRGMLIVLLWAAVVILHLTLPDAHPLRTATGENAGMWLIFGGGVALVLGYIALLSWLRRKAAQKAAPAPKSGSFSETELTRYARHIVLREIGGAGQRKLKEARVLVIGAGGLGSPALLYLAAAGVGTIGVIDDDEVDNSNLQRQVIHRDADIGRPKVQSAMNAMRAQNPNITVHPYARRLTAEIAADLFAEYDIILDGTDNFDSRYLTNRAAVATQKPLVSGALGQMEGQLSVFDPASNAPCYRCVFPKAPEAGLAPSCAEAGVLGPLPGVIGAMMAVEAIKLITGAGQPLRGEMMIYDALYAETRKIRLSRRPDCPDCGAGTYEKGTD